MPRGGARNGAGRKKGQASNKTREVADRAAAEGITPLEVMLNAMRVHHEAKEYDKAAEIAKDAAPYMHPRFSSVQVQADVEVQSSNVTELIVTTREQADAAIASLAEASGVSRQ